MSSALAQITRQGSQTHFGPTLHWAATVIGLGLMVMSLNRGYAVQLTVDVVDQSGRTLPCRVLARASDGTCRTPSKAILLDIGSDRWFVSDGRFQLNVPEGELELRVEHGLEFKRYKQRIFVPGDGARKSIIVQRWVHMKQRGFLSADNHVHVDSKSVGAMAIAEGLDFASSLTWWNGPDSERPVPDGEGSTRRLRFAGREIVASIHDAELEYGWGAVYLQNMPHPLPLASEKHRPNLDYLKFAVAQGAIVHYQGGWSREVGLDALLGVVHTVNICNNNFHMHRFQPRRRYSNLLEVPGLPVYPNTDVGMMRMNTETYYRLLNWGQRLAAGAGSAIGVKQVPIGYNRAYVEVDPSATLEQFNDAWKAGRNFVTNGPIILLTGPSGESPGDEIHLESPLDALMFHVQVLSNQPLKTIEIVQNGDVVEELEIVDDHRAEHTFHIPVQRSGWIAARSTARDDLLSDQELQQYDNAPRQRPSRLRFAHTSPIYLSVDGKPAGVRKSIEEGLLMLDQLEIYARQHAAAKWQEDFSQEIMSGRAILKRRLAKLRERTEEP